MEEINQKITKHVNSGIDVFKSIPYIEPSKISHNEKTNVKAPDLYKLRQEKTRVKLKLNVSSIER